LVQHFLYYYRLVLRRLVTDGFVWLRDGCAKRLGQGAASLAAAEFESQALAF